MQDCVRAYLLINDKKQKVFMCRHLWRAHSQLVAYVHSPCQEALLSAVFRAIRIQEGFK